MGFRALRVINEDWVKPGGGFGAHPHEDMEIVTYVLDGALEHRDSLGDGGTIRPGELQRMTAGTGIVHSEANPSPTESGAPLSDLAAARARGTGAVLRAASLSRVDERRNRLRLVASPDGRDGSLTIRQDASLYLGTLDAGREVSHALTPGRHAWLQVLRGAVQLDGRSLAEGDGAAVSDEESAVHQGRWAVRKSWCSTWPEQKGGIRPCLARSRESWPSLGRVMLCTIFFLSAVGNKIPHFNDVAELMADEGHPGPQIMLVGAIVFLIAGSLSVILGYKARIGATLLLIFLVLATYYFHDFWNATDPKEKQEQMIQFMKNLGLMGAMVLIIANGTGPMSLDEKGAGSGLPRT